MQRRIVRLGFTLALGAAVCLPALGAQAIQGAVANITGADGTAFGATVGCRIYSLVDPGLVDANSGCGATRCAPRNYTLLGGFGDPGGYACNGENTSAYPASEATADPGATFYNVIDGDQFSGACNHAAFYAVQGMRASSGFITNTGDFRQPGCAGAQAGANCFTRADLTNSMQGVTSPTSQYPSGIPSKGGFNPVPIVSLISLTGGTATLRWKDPFVQPGAMKNGVPSPVLGVRLWSTTSASCPSGDIAANGWVPGPAVGLNTVSPGISGADVPMTVPTWYGLTVRFVGPGGGPNEIETGVVGAAGVVGGASGFVGGNSRQAIPGGQVSHIVRIDARYAGRGTVSVNWTSGIESDVLGFYVARANSPAGPFTLVSQAIAPRGDGSDYRFSDRVRASLGRTLYYQIQVEKNDGTIENSGAVGVNLPPARVKKMGD